MCEVGSEPPSSKTLKNCNLKLIPVFVNYSGWDRFARSLVPTWLPTQT